MDMTSLALTTVLQAELARRAVGRKGFVDGKTTVRLDLAVEGRNGPDLGLKGLVACALKTEDPKEILWMADLEDLRDLPMVLKHFHGHARYWALTCGGHHVGASFEQLAEWYEGRPYEMWYAIEDEALRVYNLHHPSADAGSKIPRVPYHIARLLPPAGFGQMLRDFPELRAELVRDDAARLHSVDLTDFILDCCPTLHDKEWLAEHFNEEGLFNILKVLGHTHGPTEADVVWLKEHCESSRMELHHLEGGSVTLWSRGWTGEYAEARSIADYPGCEDLDDILDQIKCPFELFEVIEEEDWFEHMGQDLIEERFKGHDVMVYDAMCVHDRIDGPYDIEWMVRVFSRPTMGDPHSSKLGAAIARRLDFRRMNPDLFAEYGIDDRHEEVCVNRRTTVYVDYERVNSPEWRYIIW